MISARETLIKFDTKILQICPRHLPCVATLAGLEFGGTGLCSYRVRGVDGSCAKYLTVESYTVIYAANSYT